MERNQTLQKQVEGRESELSGGQAEIAPARSELSASARSTLAELAAVLDSKQVVGEPLRIGDATIVPLLNVGFGFGVASGSGGGSGKAQIGQGFGGAIGGGGGARPIAILVIDSQGVRMLPAPTNGSSLGALASALRPGGDSKKTE